MDRRQPRQLVDRPAKIYFAGADPLPCRVRDISRGGAKLYVFWKGWLPDTFELTDVFAKTRRTVRVVWAGESGVGVRFLDDGDQPVVSKSPGFGRR